MISNGPLSFVQVPKVASSTMRAYLTVDLKWNQKAAQDTTYFGLVRHPVARWVSGMAQCFAHRTNLKGELAPEQRPWVESIRLDVGRFVDTAWWDQHTAPQCSYYADLKNVVLFKMENINRMWKWLGVEPPKVHKNKADDMGPKKELYDFIQGTLKANPHFVERLKHFYRADMDLWRISE